MISEFHRLSQGVTQDELDRAKIGLKASTIMQGESSSARAAAIAHDFFMRGRIRTLEEIKSAIDAVTVAQLRAAAQSALAGGEALASVGGRLAKAT